MNKTITREDRERAKAERARALLRATVGPRASATVGAAAFTVAAEGGRVMPMHAEALALALDDAGDDRGARLWAAFAHDLTQAWPLVERARDPDLLILTVHRARQVADLWMARHGQIEPIAAAFGRWALLDLVRDGSTVIATDDRLGVRGALVTELRAAVVAGQVDGSREDLTRATAAYGLRIAGRT